MSTPVLAEISQGKMGCLVYSDVSRHVHNQAQTFTNTHKHARRCMCIPQAMCACVPEVLGLASGLSVSGGVIGH